MAGKNLFEDMTAEEMRQRLQEVSEYMDEVIQVSEITGPTRDLLTDLLSPLAHLGSIVAPIQDIRQILYEMNAKSNYASGI